MSDPQIQTSAQTALYWSRHGENDTTKTFGADPSIGSFTIEVSEDQQSEYGNRDVVNREVTNVNGSVSITATATHWWHLEFWLARFEDTPTDNGDGTFTWTNDGSQEYDYIDVVIANTRSGEDYVLKKCGVEATISMSSPYGGGDNNVEISYTIDVSNPEKIEPANQDVAPAEQFVNADPLYFKNSRVDTPDAISQSYVLTEFEFSLTNNDEGISQIPVVYYMSDITALSAPVTPSANSVGVQTQSVGQGTVELYDGTNTLLGSADASSSGWIGVDVGGVNVESVKLVRGGDVSTETISVNSQVDGNGTTETADVSTSTNVQGGIQDVTRSPGDRELEISRTVVRDAENDRELERILDSNGVPDGSKEDYDLVVEIGNDIVNGQVTDPTDIHSVVFTFSDLFGNNFDWSGFDERGGDISQSLTDNSSGVDVEYTVGTGTRP